MDNVKYVSSHTDSIMNVSLDSTPIGSIILSNFKGDYEDILDFENNIIAGDNIGLENDRELYLSASYASEKNIKVGEFIVLEDTKGNRKTNYLVKGLYKPPTFRAESDSFAYSHK